jgi:hypothetical protein
MFCEPLSVQVPARAWIDRWLVQLNLYRSFNGAQERT